MSTMDSAVEAARQLVASLRAEGPFQQCGGYSEGHPDPGDLMLAAADTIELLLSSQSQVERMREAGQFLLDRISEIEITEEIAREWMGHVEPAVARFRAALNPKE